MFFFFLLRCSRTSLLHWLTQKQHSCQGSAKGTIAETGHANGHQHADPSHATAVAWQKLVGRSKKMCSCSGVNKPSTCSKTGECVLLRLEQQHQQQARSFGIQVSSIAKGFPLPPLPRCSLEVGSIGKPIGLPRNEDIRDIAIAGL